MIRLIPNPDGSIDLHIDSETAGYLRHALCQASPRGMCPVDTGLRQAYKVATMRSVMFRVRLTPEERAVLDVLAEQLGVSVSDIIRMAVRAWAESQEEKAA